MAAYAVFDDTVVCTQLNAPFVGAPFGELAGEVRGIHIVFEGVHSEIVVGRAHVGVAQVVARGEKGRRVVATVVVVVDDDLDAESVFQIEEELFHVAHHHVDLLDARFLELAYLPLYEHFAAHFEKTLRAFVGKRRASGGEACRHDDGVVDFVRFELLHAFGGDHRRAYACCRRVRAIGHAFGFFAWICVCAAGDEPRFFKRPQRSAYRSEG